MEADNHGYDVIFILRPSFDAQCSICLFTLKRPVQVNPCGHRFCSDCIERLRRSCVSVDASLSCPNDQQEIQSTFRDNGIERDILNLQIICTNNGKGCNWTNALRELESHLEDCGFSEITCTIENCEINMQRRYHQNHLKVCEYRIVECTHCSEDFIFKNKKKHEKQCKKFPLECRNECGTTIRRDQMDKHVREECKNTIHSCKFVNIGCKAKGTQSWLEEHEETDTKNHLSQALETLKHHEERFAEQETQYEQRLSEQNNKFGLLSQKFDYLYSLKSLELHPQPFAYTIKDFQKTFQSAKRNNDDLLSGPFYCLDGYKQQLEIFLDDDSNSHVSVYFSIMKGPFDDVLHWPFKGIVKFSVKGDNRNGDIEVEFDATKQPQDIIEDCFQKPTTERNSSWGFPEFLSHDLMNKYIIDNSLTITCHVRPAE